jgi:hypothetical protein
MQDQSSEMQLEILRILEDIRREMRRLHADAQRAHECMREIAHDIHKLAER